jgi:hypothetical protein
MEEARARKGEAVVGQFPPELTPRVSAQLFEEPIQRAREELEELERQIKSGEK